MWLSVYIKIKKFVPKYIWVIVMKEKSNIHDDEYYYSIIRNNIRKFRLKQNLTQQDLADMVELSREYIGISFFFKISY